MNIYKKTQKGENIMRKFDWERILKIAQTVTAIATMFVTVATSFVTAATELKSLTEGDEEKEKEE